VRSLPTPQLAAAWGAAPHAAELSPVSSGRPSPGSTRKLTPSGPGTHGDHQAALGGTGERPRHLSPTDMGCQLISPTGPVTRMPCGRFIAACTHHQTRAPREGPDAVHAVTAPAEGCLTLLIS